MNTKWEQKSFGFECEIGEGALRLMVFYEHAWKVAINDRIIKHEYNDHETAKAVAVRWAQQKLKMMEAELRRLNTHGAV